MAVPARHPCADLHCIANPGRTDARWHTQVCHGELIYAFAMQLSILPVQGYVHLSQGLLPFLKHLILPALTLGLVYTALMRA